MGKALGKRLMWGLCGVLAGVVMMAPTTEAEVSTDLSGSIVVWPKVFSTEERDTVIQITNTSNNLVHVHCFYVDAQPLNPNLPPCLPKDPFCTNPPRWQETDFVLWLTRQQPFHWVASQGRRVNPLDGFGEDGSGLDAGAIPPVPTGFTGELKCFQVDASGIPFGGNNLKGEALIRRTDGDVSKYNAISILANPDLASAEPSRELRLDNAGEFPGGEGPDGEYNSCPNTLLLNHFTDGAPDPVVLDLTPGQCGIMADDDDVLDENHLCPIRTELTLVPCSQDFENQLPSAVTVQFAIFNEFEQEFSASITVDCWLNISLGDITASQGTCSLDDENDCRSDADCINDDDGFCVKNGIFSFSVLGTTSAYTRIQPVDLDGGVIGVAEELHHNAFSLELDPSFATAGTWAAYQLQQEGSRFQATLDVEGGPVVDTIVIPEI